MSTVAFTTFTGIGGITKWTKLWAKVQLRASGIVQAGEEIFVETGVDCRQKGVVVVVVAAVVVVVVVVVVVAAAAAAAADDDFILRLVLLFLYIRMIAPIEIVSVERHEQPLSH